MKKLDYYGDITKITMKDLTDNQLRKLEEIQYECWNAVYGRRVYKSKGYKEALKNKKEQIERYSKGLERVRREMRKRGI